MTVTYGRHACLERALRFFLNQDDLNCIQLIYNNAGVEQRLNSHLLGNDRVILVNNNIDLKTRKPYSNVGSIFRDAITFVPKDVEVITHFDDDDIFLPNHVSQGIFGMEKARKLGKKAYKPYNSYYKSAGSIVLVHNTMEPSIFVNYDYIIKKGYRETFVDYNQGWLDPLLESDSILIDPQGIPTMIYDWSGQIGVFKMSGGSNDDNNFRSHKKRSLDHGDQIITPISQIKAQELYKIKNGRESIHT